MCSLHTSKNEIVPYYHMKAKSCEGLILVLRSLLDQRCERVCCLMQKPGSQSRCLCALPGLESRA